MPPTLQEIYDQIVANAAVIPDLAERAASLREAAPHFNEAFRARLLADAHAVIMTMPVNDGEGAKAQNAELQRLASDVRSLPENQPPRNT